MIRGVTGATAAGFVRGTMKTSPFVVAVLAGWAWVGAGRAQIVEPRREAARPRAGVASLVSYAELAPPVREKVATITAHGPAEEFRAAGYDWLLDHPDRVALAWRRLGVPCVGIVERGPGSFGWTDGQGSDLTWQVVWRGPQGRVWYAEGQARPGPHLPLVPVKAVAVLRCRQRRDEAGRLLVAHEIDVYLQTDSKAAALVTKLIGPAAPRLAQQGAEQLLYFFAGIARHIEQHPEQTLTLLAK
jgi:hypothetical protein